MEESDVFNIKDNDDDDSISLLLYEGRGRKGEYFRAYFCATRILALFVRFLLIFFCASDAVLSRVYLLIEF